MIIVITNDFSPKTKPFRTSPDKYYIFIHSTERTQAYLPDMAHPLDNFFPVLENRAQLKPLLPELVASSEYYPRPHHSKSLSKRNNTQ